MCVTTWIWSRPVLKKRAGAPLIWADSAHTSTTNRQTSIKPQTLCHQYMSLQWRYVDMQLRAFILILFDPMWHVSVVPVHPWGPAMFMGYTVYSKCSFRVLISLHVPFVALHATCWRHTPDNWASNASKLQLSVQIYYSCSARQFHSSRFSVHSPWSCTVCVVIWPDDATRREILSPSEGEMIAHLPVEMIHFHTFLAFLDYSKG